MRCVAQSDVIHCTIYCHYSCAGNGVSKVSV